MKIFIKCITIIILALLKGCSSNAGPTCSDETVKELVLEITYEELFQQLIPENFRPYNDVMYEELKGSEAFKEYAEKDPQHAAFAYSDLPAEYILKFAEVSPAAAMVRDNIVQQIEELGFTITGIRTSSVDDQVQKSFCESNITFTNGKTFPIHYTAQNTEDGQVWVEVSGL